jgi:hypothetical protein
MEESMKYLCLIYNDEKKVAAISKGEYDALCDEALAYEAEMRKNGHLIVAEALQPAQAATSVRMQSGQVSITDGPFVETKEQLAGFFLLDARDLNEAIQLVSKSPSLRIGSIEVRPIDELIQQ